MRLLWIAVPSLCAVLLAVPALADDDGGGGGVGQVEVTNFPDPQNVTGSVEVTNLPAVQEVEVINTPLEVTSTAPARFQLVGFTDDTFLGGVGLFAFTEACGAEFDSSRMCMSQEVIETVEIPAGLAGSAWVHPSLRGGGDSTEIHDASGVFRDGRELMCNVNAGGPTWAVSDTGRSGLTVDADGRFRSLTTTSRCSTPRPVACCAPVP